MVTCPSPTLDPDSCEIYYKDWGTGQPIVFSHGWPLSADAWDSQMLFLASHGYRAIAKDRHSSRPCVGAVWRRRVAGPAILE